MRKILPGLLLSGALLLGACGGPAATTSPTSSTGGTSATSTSGDMSATSSTGGTSATSASGDMSATSSTGGTSATSTSSDMSATSTTGDLSSEAATAVAEAAGALSAVADDVTVQQGEALILDASKSAGNITDYKWTIEKAPAGAESVVGQTIREGSSGNVSIDPADYGKYFPQAGTYTVRLTVTDASGQTSSNDFSVDVP